MIEIYITKATSTNAEGSHNYFLIFYRLKTGKNSARVESFKIFA